jgi:error-prone DNA polymerase
LGARVPIALTSRADTATTRSASALLVRGRLERVEGVTNVIADKLERLPIATSSRSRDFR